MRCKSGCGLAMLLIRHGQSEFNLHLGETWWPALEESESALGERCAAFRRAAAMLPDWERVAVVTHWGFIRGLTGLPVPNGAVLRIDPSRPEQQAIPVHMPARLGES